MSLIKWTPLFDPFEEMQRTLRDISPWGDRASGRGFVPAVNVFQTEKAVMVEAPLAGVDPADVEVSVHDGVLTLKGSTKHEKEVEEKDFYRREIRSGSFFRQVPLPVAVDEEKVTADFEDGMLKIMCPKAAQKKQSLVKINIRKK